MELETYHRNFLRVPFRFFQQLKSSQPMVGLPSTFGWHRNPIVVGETAFSYHRLFGDVAIYIAFNYIHIPMHQFHSSHTKRVFQSYFNSCTLVDIDKGMTEACSSMAFMVVYDPTLYRGMPGTGMEFAMKPPKQSISGIHNVGGVSVGKPAPHVDLRIETGTKLFCENELQNVSNILTRGPHVMERYWGQEEATAAALNKNGWLNTGDVGWMDKEGRLWLIGRFKDRIKSGGENVYPSEVENVLLKHPGILAIAVVGVPHIRLNEVVTACIQ